MSRVCLSCAARGRRIDCAKCASLNPTPRYQVVQDIIGRVAQEHRLAQIAADEQFRADLRGLRDKHQERLAQKAVCRRKKFREKIQQAQEAR